MSTLVYQGLVFWALLVVWLFTGLVYESWNVKYVFVGEDAGFPRLCDDLCAGNDETGFWFMMRHAERFMSNLRSGNKGKEEK